ncbi:ABC transporter permease [Blastococcus sp. LR1]|uniref:ABC transporter permease n=1 Tax=Blastococcus sp. LR1 TaxID=2877000 RepID=UPI001CCF471A|nr:ABC transporter permease [Blastococcus sp. LR1]MCA0144813.1 ABC transporter permease [Blastococcus sp. LR1]
MTTTTTELTGGGAAPDAAAPPAAKTRRGGGGLGSYLLVRFLLIFPTIFILVTTVFVLMRLTGDPITAAQGGRLPAAELAARIKEAGYDRPILVQYWEYLTGVFTGDFGTAISDGREVTAMLTSFGAATLELAVYALIVAFVVGIPLGRLAAYLRDRWPDAVLRVFAILCYATPVFFAGLVLKLVFAVNLGWLPVAGRASTGAEIQLQTLESRTGIYLIDAIRLGDGEVISDVLEHAVLPAIALGLLTAGVFLRLVRTNVISTLGTGYVEAARSRGVSERRLLRKHAYRPALIPIVTVIGLQIALLLGGAVLTETTFEWKGLGFQLVEYLQARDFVAVQGIVVLAAVIVALVNFVVDVIAALIDPRVRY